jgi:hypothetical protein
MAVCAARVRRTAARVFARIRGQAVSLAVSELDASKLRHLLRVGGLEVSHERAALLLPMAAALLAGCDRLAALDLSSAGGCGPQDAAEE